jgi:hypothetical protein
MSTSDQADKIMLGMEPFINHTTDEGWQLQCGLEFAGYDLWGPRFANDCADVAEILARTNPQTVIVQDKREWDPANPACFDHGVAFHNLDALRERDDVFRLTICKDAHHSTEYYRRCYEEMGCDAWIVYYNPDKVAELCPAVQRDRLIRTYHSLDAGAVPPFRAERVDGCLLSGALHDRVYPLRTRLAEQVDALPRTDLLKHPGYGDNGSHTRKYLSLLSRYKVAICTVSIFQYTLRKLIEATACGCRVITDLPEGEVLPEIDDNMIRVPSCITVAEMAETIRRAMDGYEPERQREYARKALARYDYCMTGHLLARDIERLRESHNA